jgi:arginine/lysine/ornithine decarboxylase
MSGPAQNSAPLYEALERFKSRRVVPFDVPGHKRGRGNPELAELLGQRCVDIDVNSMKPLDNLTHPVSVIRDAEELAARPSARPMPFSWSAAPPPPSKA